MWSPIISLVKTNRYHFEFHSLPMWNEYHLWLSALSCCGWFASSFDQCLYESIHVRIPLEMSWLALFLSVACFSWSTLLIASTKHLKCSSDHYFHVSLPSTTLGLPTHRWQAPILGRSDISPKNHSWYSLEITWLIDPSDGLSLMCNLESFFFKSFYFYLFKSFSFY